MRLKLFNNILIILLCMGTISAYSQKPVFRNYTEEEGLPGNDVYDALNATNGMMWFATDNGVSQFDGLEFVNYGVADGLPLNAVIKLYEDAFGKIWFLSYNGMLSYYDGNKIESYKYNDTIIRHFSDNYFNKICVDSSGGVLLSPRQGGKAYIEANGNLHTRPILIPYLIDSCYLSFEDRGDDYFLTIQSIIPEECSYNYPLFHNDRAYYIKAAFVTNEFQRNFVETGPNEYVVSYRNIIYTIRDHKLISRHIFDEAVLEIFYDTQEKLWVSTKYNNGIYRFDNVNCDGEPEHFLKGYTVTSVVQDREDDFWLCTEGNGVFFGPSLDFKLFQHPQVGQTLNVISMALYRNRLWLTTRDKGLYSGIVMNGDISSLRRTKIEEPTDWIKHISVDSDGYLWLTSTKHLRYDPAGFSCPPDSIVSRLCLANGLGDTMLVGSNYVNVYFKDQLQHIYKPDSVKRVYSLFQGKDKKIWVGTLYGLYAIENNQMIRKGNLSPVLNERIICMDEINEMLVIGTAANGLVFLRNDSIVYHISDSNGLVGSTVKTIYPQDDSTLWVGTKYGLNMLRLDKSERGYYIENFDVSDGLPANEINNIKMHDGFIWLATNIGLVSFDPYTLKAHREAPLIRINSVQINGKDTLLSKHYVLEHDQNDIRIDFRGISFRDGDRVSYRYLMRNFNKEINITRNNWVSFPNMPPGEYTFLLNAGNVHGIWNNEPTQISFTIKKHFTNTLGFLIFLIVFSSAVMVAITLFFQKQRKIKEDARNELAKMEHRMFRLQMNPHFVFNSLLAIQGFMYQNNPRDAGRYLTSFAKLIRHTLYGSSEEYIPLDSEIEALRYYLDLQRLRFNEKFDFEIVIEESIIPESLKIPPLLIQPFLENAIEHGLQHKKGQGLLSVSLAYDDDCLKIEVLDNGIGREKAMKMQEEKGKLHKSLGMEIVQKRVDSLKTVLGYKITMEIIDLKNDEGRATGTLVRLCIPYKST